MGKSDNKTTSIFEEAINLISQLPENHVVFVTGAHTKWMYELERAFRSAGLVGVKIVTPGQIRDGCLNGYKGRLLIDDIRDMSMADMLAVLSEKEILELSSR